jgi:hypothetical protein
LQKNIHKCVRKLRISVYTPRYCRDAIYELCPKKNVGVTEHPILQGHDDKLRNHKSILTRWNKNPYLRFVEMSFQHVSDVLRVRQIQSSVYFVQDVQRSRFEQQHRQNERESRQRALSSAQFRQAVLPHAP